MSVISVNKNNFENEVIKNEELVLVDFNADWCGPCQMLKLVIDEISNENKNVKIVSVNVDEEEELSIKYQVSSIPCLVLFKDGKEIDRKVGFVSKEVLQSMLEVK